VPPPASRLDQLRRLARLFESAFQIPGTNIRFGLDPIIGLVPGIGDLAAPVLTIMILWHAAALRVPKIVLARMVLNTLIDVLLGVIPVAGDLFDVAWKSNDWNLALVERHAVQGARATSGDWLFVILAVLVVIGVSLIPLLAMAWLLIWLGRPPV
jgi:hypothetical protein